MRVPNSTDAGAHEGGHKHGQSDPATARAGLSPQPSSRKAFKSEIVLVMTPTTVDELPEDMAFSAS